VNPSNPVDIGEAATAPSTQAVGNGSGLAAPASPGGNPFAFQGKDEDLNRSLPLQTDDAVLDVSHHDRLGVPLAVKKVVAAARKTRSALPTSTSLRASSDRPRAVGSKRVVNSPTLQIPQSSQPRRRLRFAAPENRDPPPMCPSYGVIILGDRIVLKQLPKHGRGVVITTEVFDISRSFLGILGRIRRKGRLNWWAPAEDMPGAYMDDDFLPDVDELIFDCDDILGPDWRCRDGSQQPDADRHTTGASALNARKLRAAKKRVERLNEYARRVSGSSMLWCEELQANQGSWRIAGVFYRAT
jgi:hypothetical protein